MKIETLAVHAGRHIDPVTGAVAAPIHLSSTFERDTDGEYSRGFSYSREDNPNRRTLEQCLAALEGGAEALMFSSGLAVVNAVVQGMEPGDHLLVAGDVYYGLRRVVGEVFAKWPIETSYVDMTDMAAVEAAMRPNTRLVWVETPSNPLLKVIDLAALAAVARKGNAVSICDSTFAPPIIQRPLDFGIDMVMHSTTKYIAGHSDTVGGVLVRSHENYLFERCRKSQRYGGAVPSPFECWLALRSVETLPCRVRAQSDNALRLAFYLRGHPSVEAVHYPGLEAHPQHALAKRQMTGGFGGMLSFEVRGGEAAARAVSAAVKLFTRATSLGGTHSLIEHRASIEGPQSKTPRGLLRVSAGLEHADDLIADLEQALSH
jgi:cystathionine gamma-synthase